MLIKYLNYYISKIDTSYLVYDVDLDRCLRLKKMPDLINEYVIIVNNFRFNIIDMIYYILLFLSPLAYLGIIYSIIHIEWRMVEVTPLMVLGNLLIFVVNILFHELGHWLFMLYNGIRVEIPKIAIMHSGIGIFTNTKGAILFPTFRKIEVYTSGIVFNITFLFCAIQILPNFLPYVIITVVMIFYNIVPNAIVQNDAFMVTKLLKQKRGG